MTVAYQQTTPPKPYPVTATTSDTQVRRPPARCRARPSAQSSVSNDEAGLAGRIASSNDSLINRRVSNGRSDNKECVTSGTSTNELCGAHVQLGSSPKIQSGLDALGVQTALSRNNDDALVLASMNMPDRRIAIRLDAIVSTHGDGVPEPGKVSRPLASPPMNDACRTGHRLARTFRDELVASGFEESAYRLRCGLYARADLAGWNLADYPVILLQLGNMRNAVDAAQLESESGRTN